MRPNQELKYYDKPERRFANASLPQTSTTEPEKRQPRVFISYAFEEADFARQIVSDLTNAGIACWLDTEQIRGGKTFSPALGEAIANSLAVIFIATRKSLQSSWVSKEINWALTHEKEIIPLLFENVRKETGFFPVNDYQWVSMLDGENYAENSSGVFGGIRR